jgi:NitT/TauT family transport system substrate-binding protein
MNKKTLLVTLLLATVALVAALLLRKPSESTEPSPKLVKVTIAQAGDFYLYAPLYVAQDLGLFERQGASVTIISTGGDEKTWAAVLSGDAQFGVADPTFVAIASQRGQAGRIIATIVNGVPFWGITKDSRVPQIAAAAQLDGFTVATFPSPSTAYTLQKRMFEKAGLAPKIREGGFGTLLALTESQQADIALELEPNVSQALKRGYRIAYSLADTYGDFTITGLTATPIYLNEHRREAQMVVRAIADAMSYLHQHPVESSALLAKRFPEISPDVAESALKRVLAAGIIPRSPVVSRPAWEKAVQLRIDSGDLAPPEDVMALVDESVSGN